MKAIWCGCTAALSNTIASARGSIANPEKQLAIVTTMELSTPVFAFIFFGLVGVLQQQGIYLVRERFIFLP